MSTKLWHRVFSVLVLAGMLVTFVRPGSALANPRINPVANPPVEPTAAAGVVEVVSPLKADVSPALRDIKPQPVKAGEEREIPAFSLPKTEKSTPDHKTVAPDRSYAPNMPNPLVNFEAIHNTYGVQPPDTEGDVGPNHYVQWVNLGFQIWDKNGNSLYGPANGNTLWTGFGGACQSTNDGDPIALYDSLADRWLMSQFALPNYPNGPFYQCIAISQTADPTGAWYRYAYQIPVNKMNDYPKFGVWPDAYYLTVNQFNGGTGTWGGAGVGAFQRAQMLAGNPAALLVYIDVGAVNLDYGGMLPADLDGPPNGLVPPANAPGLFLEWDDSTWPLGDPTDMLRVWQFHVDWTTPANSTFGANASYAPNYMIPTANVDPDMCGTSRNCIPQPGTSNGLDAISDRLMYRLQYRNFGGYQTLVSNHTVDVDNTNHAGVHWFELHNTGSGWGMYQQGVFGPDANNRWMASAALDHSGNLAVGYSVSSSATFPSVRYAGRLIGDPLGTLAQGEASLVAGTGSQTSFSNRWGDYSMLGVDPTDDCTFWYTQEYYQTNSSDWRTRVGSFKFPSCSIGPTGTLNGTVTNASNSNPISGAQVTATSSPTQTLGTTTAGAGTYEMVIPTGIYTVTASAFGFLPSTVSSVGVLSGTVTTHGFALTPAASSVVSGTVTDTNTGWPLYASVTVQGIPGDPVWTDPENGSYSITLPNGNYTFDVEAFYPGYLPDSAVVNVAGPTTQDFTLDPDLVTCDAPGYQPQYDWLEDFEGDNGGFTVSSVSGTPSWAWGVPTSGPGVAHSGVDVWATNLSGNYNSSENGYITSPNIDLSAFSGATIVMDWYQWAVTESGYDYISVEASNNGGTSWSVVYGPLSGSMNTAWALKRVALNSTYAVSNFRIRFHFTSDTSVQYAGWYVDDIGLSAQYPPAHTVVYTQDFNATNGAYTHAGTNDNWQWGVPTTTFPGGCAGGSAGCWDTGLAGNYLASADASLYSPVIDLSGVTLPPGSHLYVAWDQAIAIESASWDHAYANISVNGGAYTNLWQHTGGTVATPWTARGPFDITTAAGSNIRLQYRLTSDSSYQYEGWSVDNVQVYYAEPWTPSVTCEVSDGSIVVGNVYDANTILPLVGADVVSDENGAFTTIATPADPNLDDGFYYMFATTGTHEITASLGVYQPDVATVPVPHYDAIRQDFDLTAGLLSYMPDSFDMTLQMGYTTTQQLTLNNVGSAAASFKLKELDKGVEPLGPFEQPNQVVKPFRQHFLSTEGLPNMPPLPEAAPFAAGDIIQSWPTGLISGWGLGYNLDAADVWIGDIGAGGGTDLAYRYLTNGTNTGNTIDISWAGVFAADFTYNRNTETLWAMDVGGGDCIHELDPVRQVPTGNTICPTWGVSQRGLAYDPSTDTYFAGGWNDLMIYHFASDGTMLQSVNVGLATSGLAYNPNTQHLFVMVNASPNPVYVLDTANNFAILGQFTIAGFTAYSGAGLEMDCDGNLWAVNQVGDMVYEVDSGELTSMCTLGVPWLSESPITGTLPLASSQIVDLSFDAGVPEITQPGIYHAQLKISNDTPYVVANLPLTLTVTAPPTMGKLEGIVTGLGYCDGDPAPIEGAVVSIEGSGGTITVTTDISGTYSRWLNVSEGPYIVSVTAVNHTFGMVSGVVIVNPGTTAVGFNLRWLEPCVSAYPAALDVDVPLGHDRNVVLDITNGGAASSNFEILEVPAPAIVAEAAGESLEDARKAPDKVGSSLPVWASNPDDILITEGFDGGIMPPTSWSQDITIPGYTWKIMTVGTPYSGTHSADVEYDPALTQQDEWLLSPELVITEGTLSFWSMGSVYWCKTTYNNCDLNIWLVIGDVGGGDDILVGKGDDVWPANFTWAESVFDLTSLLPGGPVRIGFQYYGSDGAQVGLDVISLDGVAGSLDIPWLAEDPITGTVAHDSSFPLDVTFTAFPTMTVGDVYTASLIVKSDDPVNPKIVVPVTMNVVAPVFGVEVSADQVGSGGPGGVLTYTVTVTNTSNFATDSFTVTLGTHVYTTSLSTGVVGPLAMGETATFVVTVVIPEDAPIGDHDTVQITVTSAGDPTKTAITNVTTNVYLINIYLPLIWKVYPNP